MTTKSMNPIKNTTINTIPEPLKKGYTIYTKTGCYYCTLAKQLLYTSKHTIYICDDLYLKDNDAFFNYMQEYTKKSHKTFPLIFNNGEFVGGYSEIKAQFDLNQTWIEIKQNKNKI
jgi:glutaredoxin